MRKKHEAFKNIRKKDEHFRYFLFDIDRGMSTDVFIHKETEVITNEDEYIQSKMEFIQDKYNPQLIYTEISPLGKWEYNSLKQSGVTLFKEFCNI